MSNVKKQNILLLTVICCASLALISIAFAALSSTLKVAGQASVAAQSWDIDFTNTVGTKWTTAQTLTGTKTNLAELPTSSSGAFSLPVDQTASGFLGSLKMSGDKITYTWYVQNFGTFEAKYSISGLIKTDKYVSGSNVDISCNTSDNSTDKTFCNNYVKTTLTIDGVVADASSSYTLAKAGQTGDSSTLVLTIEIIGENQIYTVTAGAFESRYSSTNPSMLLGGIEMLDSSNDLNISVTGLTLTGTQSVAETTPVVVTTTKESCSVEVNTSYIFNYTGDEQTFTSLCDGTYKLEVWGAQGGTAGIYTGGYGGYSVGEVDLVKGSTLYVNVGQEGGLTATADDQTYPDNPSYNGGGAGYPSGGGATHIANVSGELSTLLSNVSNIYIVAGGGGGAKDYGRGTGDYSGQGGSGGGYIGGNGIPATSTVYGYGTGGTQTEGGYYTLVSKSNGATYGSFGQGAVIHTAWTNYYLHGAGGGGGFYGGGSLEHSPSGGGSGYIGNSSLSNKVMYCYNCTESSEESTKTVSTTNVSETATANYAKQGNGYAKITYLGE